MIIFSGFFLCRTPTSTCGHTQLTMSNNFLLPNPGARRHKVSEKHHAASSRYSLRFLVGGGGGSLQNFWITKNDIISILFFQCFSASEQQLRDAAIVHRLFRIIFCDLILYHTDPKLQKNIIRQHLSTQFNF